jgi:hypothetical protein
VYQAAGARLAATDVNDSCAGTPIELEAQPPVIIGMFVDDPGKIPPQLPPDLDPLPLDYSVDVVRD